MKLRNHTLLIHSGGVGGSTSDLSSSSLSSLNSTTHHLSDSATSPTISGITLKNSINLVAIKSSKSATINNGLSNAASTSKGSSKEINGKTNSDVNKIPKLTPMKGYDGLGILTPATSPKVIKIESLKIFYVINFLL